MKAAVLHGPRDLRVEAVDVPALVPGEVLIKVEAAGICGTDVHVYEGALRSKLPVIPGHEFAGIIAESKSDRMKPGTRVFARGSWGCGRCEWCAQGLPARCKDRKMLGRSVDGAFAQYVRVPANVVYPLPAEVSFDEAQSLVTVACAVHAVQRAGGSFGEDAIVVGPGHAGLLVLQVLKAAGYDKVAVVGGTRPLRLRIAKELGADLTVLASDPQMEAALAELIPDGAGVVVETSGSPRGLELALKLVRVGGTVVVFSIYDGPMERFDPGIFYEKEVSVVGSKGAGNCYREAIRLLETGRVVVSPLITHRLPLERAAEGFALMTDRGADAVRVVIRPWSDE